MAKAGPDALRKAPPTPTNVIRTTIVAITYEGTLTPFPQRLRVKGSRAACVISDEPMTLTSTKVNGVVDVSIEIRSAEQRGRVLKALQKAGFRQVFVSP